MEREMSPYVGQSLVYRNNPDNFKTTYITSYPKVPTEVASHPDWYTRDMSPYPTYQSPLHNTQAYQSRSYDEEKDYVRQQRERQYWSRFEDDKLTTDEYKEQSAMNRRNYDEEPVLETPRGRQERGRAGAQHHDDRAKYMRTQYDDLLADGPDGQPLGMEELELAICNKCFKSNACMNRLGCYHQFCDACLRCMPGSDNPFRGTIRWHYCCEVCKKWTSEAKVIRTNPYGRRLLKFHDIGYFKTS